MPWCEQCSRFYNPNSVAPDGSCVKCGAHIGEPIGVEVDTPEGEDAKETKIPWHFWLLVVALVIYLGWRLIQGIVWVAHQF